MTLIDQRSCQDSDTLTAPIAHAAHSAWNEGAADFALGKMPRHPHDAHYLRGWIDALRDRVTYEDGKSVYPDACYRVDCTTNPNGFFSHTEVAASASDARFDDR